MTGEPTDEQLLEQFRQWLNETRREAASLSESTTESPAPAAAVGLDRLVEEFTALRHEIKLQTRGARGLEERLEGALGALDQAVGSLRSASQKDLLAPKTGADKTLVMALAELDEALDRGREQWARSAAVFVGSPDSSMTARLDEVFAKLSWWQRRLSWLYHQQARQQIEEREAQARAERESMLNAVLSGYGLIQQRLSRTMTNAGILRIRAVGQPVDPEQMIVVEVVEAAGPPGRVVEEVRRGYTWQGQLLRPAEVRAIKTANEPGTDE